MIYWDYYENTQRPRSFEVVRGTHFANEYIILDVIKKSDARNHIFISPPLSHNSFDVIVPIKHC